MKRVTKYKKLISFVVVLIVLITIFTIPANATWNPTSKNRFAAWLGSALLALNITMQSTVAPIEQMYEYIADPVAQQIEYTYPATGWEDDIMNRAVIKIAKDSVEIDGVKYTDVWLSNSAAEKFRVNAFDFQTGYALASNTSGTFASGSGYVYDEPIYNVNNVNRTVDYYFPAVNGTYDCGLKNVTVGDYNASKVMTSLWDNGSTSGTSYADPSTMFPVTVYTEVDMNNGGAQCYIKKVTQPWNQFGYTVLPTSEIHNTPFDFDYVTGTIPADQVLGPDEGMNIRVPSDTPGLQVFIENNIDYTNDNGKYIDFSMDPDVRVEIDDLIDVLAPILVDLDFGDVTFTEMPDTPVPQPDLPDTLFPDTQVDQALQPIINNINNQSQIIQQLPDQITGPIVEAIPNITEICENIDTAPYHDLDTGLDHLPTVFLPFITDLRSALGIWHYVTEWIGQISTTFAFVTGCLVGTSIMTPIYAAIAGFMCIKVYRRMTG